MGSGNHIVDQHETDERRRDKADRCPCGCRKTEELVGCGLCSPDLRCEGYECACYMEEIPILMRLWHWLFETKYFLECPEAKVIEACTHCGARRD